MAVGWERPEEERRQIAIYRAAIDGDDELKLTPPPTKEELEMFISMRDDIKERKANGEHYIYDVPFD